MSSTKKRAAPRPPTNGVSSPVKGNESANSSNGTAPVGDEFIDKTIELTIVLPNQSQEKIHIVPSTALFDLRTQLCGKYKLNPSSHKLEPVDKNGRAISCTSSSTIESTEAVAVHLIPRMKDTPKITPIKTVEQTVRLTVKTSQAHQQVVRVKPNVPLRSILSNILDKTNSSKENQKYLELRHPLKMSESLDLSKSLDEYNKLREVFVVDTRVHIDSDAETVSIHTADKHATVTRDGSTKKKKKIKSLFKFGKKKSKGQIVSPTSTSPPASISEVPEFYNEKGVDAGALESRRPTSLKQSTSQQNESLHGQVSGKTQEKNAQRSSEGLGEDESDVKKAPVSPPARPIAPPRIKSRAPVATTRPHTTGKKKAPAPPTPSLPKSSAESSLPASPIARPEKPPRRQSIEKQKSIDESLQDSEKAVMEREQDVVTTDDAAAVATVTATSVDDISISSAEEVGIEIEKDDKLSEGRLTPDDIETKAKQVSDVIQISLDENAEDFSTIEEASGISKTTSDEENNTELTPTKDDMVSREEVIPKETERVVEIEESVPMTSSENTDVVIEPNQKQDVPTVPDNAVHHVIIPGLGLAMNDVITEDDLQDLSDSEIPVIVDDESDTDDELPNRDENKMVDIDASNISPPSISDEKEKPVTPPIKLDQELPPPTLFKDDKSPSPPVNQNEEAPAFNIAQEVPSPTLQAPIPPPVIKEQTTTMSQQPIVEEAISRVDEEPPRPPPLKDDDNLFTTPSDYNVYEEPETDMAFIETQALKMLQQFTTPPPDDLSPTVVDGVAPAEIEIKMESEVPSTPSVVKEVVPVSFPVNETEFKAHSSKQDVDERSDEQTKEEIAKLKAELEAAKQKLAQRDAEAEYARKNPYTIVPEPTSSEPGPTGKRKTFTFLPTQRPVRSFEDYETAPQTVISITKGGDIRGMVLVKDRKPEEKLEEKPSASNVQTVPTIAANSSTQATNVFGQPPSKTTVPVVKKAPVTTISTNSNPRSDTVSGNTKTPTVASIMVNHLQSKSTKQEIPDVKIVPSQTTGKEVTAPQPNTEAITRKPAKVSGGYVGSAILKQPATVNSKPVPAVYDWTSNKKSTLPNYYKRFLGIDAVTGTNKAVDKFKSNVEEKKKVSNGYSDESNQGDVGKQPVTPSPSSPTKPAVATKPVSLGVKPNSSSVSQSSSSAIAASLNKALNPSPITSLPLPPEEKSSRGVNNYEFDVAPLPPPPEEFLSPTTLLPSPTLPKNVALTPGYVGISSAKPFGSSSSGGPKFRRMSAAFKQDESNSNTMNGSQ